MKNTEKMQQLGKNRSAIRELFEYGKRRTAEIGAENVFDFSIGNPSVPAPAHLTEVMTDLLRNTDPVRLHGYTSAQGDIGVRRAIAESVGAENGCPVDPDLIYMTCGAAASLTISLHATVNPGDEVIVISPYFPEYRVFVEKAGAALVEVPAEKDTFRLDFDALEGAITARTRAVIINSPNNPTGVILPPEEIAHLGQMLECAETRYGSEITLISDEPYKKLVYGNVPVSYVPAAYPRTLICYSYSKALSLPGERIGYILVPPTMPNAADVYAAVCGAGRALGFVCAPSLLQYTVAACVDDTADIAVYKTNRDLLLAGLREIGYSVTEPDGAFYLFVKSPEPNAAAFAERAKKYELLLVPSDSFGVPGYVRISYCVETDRIRRALPAFRALWQSYADETR